MRKTGRFTESVKRILEAVDSADIKKLNKIVSSLLMQPDVIGKVGHQVLNNPDSYEDLSPSAEAFNRKYRNVYVRDFSDLNGDRPNPFHLNTRVNEEVYSNDEYFDDEHSRKLAYLKSKGYKVEDSYPFISFGQIMYGALDIPDEIISKVTNQILKDVNLSDPDNGYYLENFEIEMFTNAARTTAFDYAMELGLDKCFELSNQSEMTIRDIDADLDKFNATKMDEAAKLNEFYAPNSPRDKFQRAVLTAKGEVYRKRDELDVQEYRNYSDEIQKQLKLKLNGKIDEPDININRIISCIFSKAHPNIINYADEYNYKAAFPIINRVMASVDKKYPSKLNEASSPLNQDDFAPVEEAVLNALYNGIKSGFGQRDIESILSHEVEFGSDEYMKIIFDILKYEGLSASELKEFQIYFDDAEGMLNSIFDSVDFDKWENSLISYEKATRMMTDQVKKLIKKFKAI